MRVHPKITADCIGCKERIVGSWQDVRLSGWINLTASKDGFKGRQYLGWCELCKKKYGVEEKS